MTAFMIKSNLGRCIAISLSLSLGACGGSGSSGTEALELGLGMATLGLTAAALATGGGGANTTTNYNVPVVTGDYAPPKGGYTAPSGNGYSQRGAFEDCARLYAGVPGPEAARNRATCNQRANNMGSLR